MNKPATQNLDLYPHMKPADPKVIEHIKFMCDLLKAPVPIGLDEMLQGEALYRLQKLNGVPIPQTLPPTPKTEDEALNQPSQRGLGAYTWGSAPTVCMRCKVNPCEEGHMLCANCIKFSKEKVQEIYQQKQLGKQQKLQQQQMVASSQAQAQQSQFTQSLQQQHNKPFPDMAPQQQKKPIPLSSELVLAFLQKIHDKLDPSQKGGCQAMPARADIAKFMDEIRKRII